jgi:allophanate hydrolase subunit 2
MCCRPSRSSYFAGDDVDALTLSEHVVTGDSNRVALRLQGRPLQRTDGMEFPPQGLVPGAIQVPPNGQPVVFLADHPVTGGYPVVGVLTGTSLAAAAQIRPGEPLRIRWCGAQAANARQHVRP